MSARSTASRITVVSDYVEAPLTYLADTSVKPVTYNPPMARARSGGSAITATSPPASTTPGRLSATSPWSARVPAGARHRGEGFLRRGRGRSASTIPRSSGCCRGDRRGQGGHLRSHRAQHRARGRPPAAPPCAVHNDYTENSAPQRVRDLLPPAEAEARLKRRYAEINVWRPIAGPVRSTPLALCDARSLDPADLVPLGAALSRSHRRDLSR